MPGVWLTCRTEVSPSPCGADTVHLHVTDIEPEATVPVIRVREVTSSRAGLQPGWPDSKSIPSASATRSATAEWWRGSGRCWPGPSTFKCSLRPARREKARPLDPGVSDQHVLCGWPAGWVEGPLPIPSADVVHCSTPTLPRGSPRRCIPPQEKRRSPGEASLPALTPH